MESPLSNEDRNIYQMETRTNFNYSQFFLEICRNLLQTKYNIFHCLSTNKTDIHRKYTNHPCARPNCTWPVLLHIYVGKEVGKYNLRRRKHFLTNVNCHNNKIKSSLKVKSTNFNIRIIFLPVT